MSNDKNGSLRGCIKRFFARETRGFLGGFGGGIAGAALAFTLIHYFTKVLDITKVDPVAVANTYIVYTTFVITAVAAVLGIAGLIFANHFALEKDAHTDHAFKALLTQLKTDEERAVAFVTELMSQPAVVQCVADNVESKVAEYIEFRKDQAGKREHQARNERDVLKDLG
ncbi:hypothetical protein [Burkholderia ambifaria]|uniref:hypothetical protein n=1 Tax=Burkholderia ambifaria TaxID=152480 RepID=UPI00158BD279|nr:hypothetical protein [Burkholderia ambifaria]